MIVDVPNKSFSIILSNIDCASNELPASCSNLDSYSLFKVFELVEFLFSLALKVRRSQNKIAEP